jgi:putative SOS response-associated peptidase YedK
MCNRYDPTPKRGLHDFFRVQPPIEDYAGSIGPLQRGPYLTAREAFVGQWGLIPDTSPTKRPATRNGMPLSTNNARREGVSKAVSFVSSWAKGRRCLVPADAFYEPCWETGGAVLWRFQRTDGRPWALAGLWSDWTDPRTGEIHHSYTMILRVLDVT